MITLYNLSDLKMLCYSPESFYHLHVVITVIYGIQEKCNARSSYRINKDLLHNLILSRNRSR